MLLLFRLLLVVVNGTDLVDLLVDFDVDTLVEEVNFFVVLLLVELEIDEPFSLNFIMLEKHKL
jgi:hypothetical protein